MSTDIVRYDRTSANQIILIILNLKASHEKYEVEKTAQFGSLFLLKK